MMDDFCAVIFDAQDLSMVVSSYALVRTFVNIYTSVSCSNVQIVCRLMTLGLFDAAAHLHARRHEKFR